MLCVVSMCECVSVCGLSMARVEVQQCIHPLSHTHACESIRTHTLTHTHMHIYTHIGLSYAINDTFANNQHEVDVLFHAFYQNFMSKCSVAQCSAVQRSVM
jgi:hypothetical protein